jgi:hypothetical protein
VPKVVERQLTALMARGFHADGMLINGKCTKPVRIAARVEPTPHHQFAWQPIWLPNPRPLGRSTDAEIPVRIATVDEQMGHGHASSAASFSAMRS